MRHGSVFLLRGPSKVVFVFLCVWAVVLVVWLNVSVRHLQAASPPELPFGVFTLPGGGIYAQDFSYNMLYFKGIRDRLVQHPYRLEDQETIIRQLVPEARSGMSHAYSPVAFVLAYPLLKLPGAAAYFFYTCLCAVGILLLYFHLLLPRAKTRLQLAALTICVGSTCVMHGYIMGQTTLLTTTLIGFFWALLQSREVASTNGKDLLIALLFWGICLKPSLAPIPFMLMLGARAWRPLLIGFGLLLLTWLMLADDYGGWWMGLQDYLNLVNHYDDAEMTPFMQRGHAFTDREMVHLYLTQTEWFALDRNLELMLSLTALGLRWFGRIDGPTHFEAAVWIFLLFSPYLLPTEDWVICLLIVEGNFFATKGMWAWPKFIILFCMMNLRAGLTFPIDVEEPCKYVLGLWALAEWMAARARAESSWKERYPLPMPAEEAAAYRLKNFSAPTSDPSSDRIRDTRISC